MKRGTPEGDVSKPVAAFLKSSGLFYMRMQTGHVQRGSRHLWFGTPGCADFVVFLKREVYWLETKSTVGKQAENQREFQDKVLAEGHHYILARSVDDVIEAIEGCTE